MIDHKPKVFISYAWTTPDYQKQIVSIAEQLVGDGIDVVLDVWDLKKGNDKYQFMEQCVTDSTIDKVLIFSDKRYSEKADKREGGVGDETAVITSEVYGKSRQDKYLPIIMERDENGKEYVPSYLKSRIYTDFTNPDTYEEDYKSLVRFIYEVTEFKKPNLGSFPTWLTEETPSETQGLKRIIARIKNADSSIIDDFHTIFVEKLQPFYKQEYKEIKRDNTIEFEILSDLDKTKELRDEYLNFVKRIIKVSTNSGEVLGDLLEKLYNLICCHKTFIPSSTSFNTYSIDIFKYLCWEILICTVALLIHSEKYEDIHNLLCRTFFLKIDPVSERIEAVSYMGFYFYSRYIEDYIKPRTSNHNLFTLAGNILCTERLYEPLLSTKAIAFADLFMYQVHNGFSLDSLDFKRYWFPLCYVYSDNEGVIWKKLVSKRYCRKMFPLFGVNTLEAFKERIKKCIDMEPVGYQFSYHSAPTIKSYIQIEQIGIYE